MRNLFWLFLCFISVSSCDDDINNTANSISPNTVTENTGTPTITSFDFVKNIYADNFYEKDQIGKTVTICNLILACYEIDNSDNETSLDCFAYSPETKKYIGATVMGSWGIEGDISNCACIVGKNIVSSTGMAILGNEYINHKPILFEFSLKYPKDVKNISFYEGTARGNCTMSEKGFIYVENIIEVTGIYRRSEYQYACRTFYFDNCEFTITNSFAKDSSVLNSFVRKTWIDYNDNVSNERAKYVNDSIELKARIDSENHFQDSSKN